jgi:N-acetylmuramoyl-L-alanine amidase
MELKKLATHPTKRWGKRSLNSIKQVVVHQVLSEGTFENIAKYHVTPSKDNHISKTGAPGICYHYGVEKDGTIYIFNDESYITWHCKGHNIKSIGILVRGNFSGPSWKGTEKPTEKQIEGLKNLLDFLIDKYPEIKIFGHCDLANKPNCPGTIIANSILDYRSLDEKTF